MRFTMHLNNILHFGISFLVTRIISNPVLNNKNDTANSTLYSEQIISDELWDYLTEEKLDHENDSEYSDFLPQDSESFYVNRSNFRWSKNVNLYEIPYGYELDEQTFDEDYQKRVENAIELLNFKLNGCIKFR